MNEIHFQVSKFPVLLGDLINEKIGLFIGRLMLSTSEIWQVSQVDKVITWNLLKNLNRLNGEIWR